MTFSERYTLLLYMPNFQRIKCVSYNSKSLMTLKCIIESVSIDYAISASWNIYDAAYCGCCERKRKVRKVNYKKTITVS